MLLKIAIPSGDLVIPAVNAGPLLASLENAFAVRSEGYGKDEKWVKADGNVEVSFVADTLLEEAPEPLKKALANYEQAQSNWLAEYNKRLAAEKERNELKAELETIRAAVQS